MARQSRAPDLQELAAELVAAGQELADARRGRLAADARVVEAHDRLEKATMRYDNANNALQAAVRGAK